MNTFPARLVVLFVLGCLVAWLSASARAESPQALPQAFVDGDGPGWVALGKDDFVNVNCDADTWVWEDGVAHCTGEPTGVIRTKKQYTNFELVLQWKHLRSAGNSGVFVWATEESMHQLEPNKYPDGIEVQILDHGFAEEYEKSGKKADWFTTDGDIFPVGRSKMTPFPRISPDGKRSFPSKNISRGVGQWNHYYIRCTQGEVRLWVNGEEVSGGTGCEPRRGYMCLESEGSPVKFKGLCIRELS